MPVRRAIVPVDGSEVALKAARLASRFAAKHGWKVILLHVMEMPPMPPSSFSEADRVRAIEGVRRYGEQVLSDAEQVFRDSGAPVTRRLVEGSPAERIIEEAEAECCGIVVIGSTGLGRGKLQSLLFGSVAEHVIRKAKVPVLLVKEDTEVD